MTAADSALHAFVDTNVLVYAFANDDAVRSRAAQELIDRLMAARAFHTSTQVLQELFVTLTRKGRRTVGASEILASLDRLAKFPVFQIDYAAIRAAAELSAGHKLNFWDALIIVAADRSGAPVLYTEDLQHGRTILGVRIVNPFRRN